MVEEEGIESVREVPMNWIKVTTSLPEPGVEVLLYSAGDCRVGCREKCYEALGYWWNIHIDPDECNDFDADNVTHWMPLPPKP
jgi:hypothetical protein